mgnify:CR=1 FL=1
MSILPTRVVLAIVTLVVVLTGCMSSTKLVKNESAKVKYQDYSDLYFLQIDDDPKNIGPKAVSEFQSMGFNVKVVPADKPIEGTQGTGFVISSEGHVLTCAHVIGDETTATLWINGVRYEADVLNSDAEKDLAVLKTRAPLSADVRPLSFRNSSVYRIGADVSTVGYPLGSVLGKSIRYTKGSISAVSGIKDNPSQLQVSAQTQPGNSGGPLFDQQGVVIGVIQQTLNSARIMEETGGALPQNVNFAIKGHVVLDYLKASNGALHGTLAFDQGHGVDELQKSVARVRSGIISDEFESKPKLVVRLDYISFWDIWHRFRFFAVRVFDFESQELLFAAGQERDNVLSNEDKVFQDTFQEVRKALNRSR